MLQVIELGLQLGMEIGHDDDDRRAERHLAGRGG